MVWGAVGGGEVRALPEAEKAFRKSCVQTAAGGRTACGATADRRRLGAHVLAARFCPDCLARASVLLSAAALQLY